MKITSKSLALAAAATIAGTALAQAPQGPGTGPGMMGSGGGPGMMGGYGPGGQQRGYGPGYGMGPGMMGGYGPGYGMGPGMMGGYGPGYGMGPGMMGGYVPRYGMGPLQMLDLDDAQRGKVNHIGDALRKKNWQILGQMQDEQAKLRDLYLTEKTDRSAIVAAYKQLFDLRLQRVEAMLDARAELEKVLTKEQRDELRRFGPAWMMEGVR
ncbi:MAG: Spy/CpxP family protein refolding chaperone [Betaproteobacteria bacterium]|jgi:Spy/CpxP family protein refolding chaperone|nr:Spy/CpxP family protein refolding chaperone [Betaproteobacteria bacterium]